MSTFKSDGGDATVLFSISQATTDLGFSKTDLLCLTLD